MKAAAHRVKNTKGINAWQINAARVAASSQTLLPTSPDAPVAFDFFDQGIIPFMKEAISKLGIDPELHQVSSTPHQLILFGRGEGEPFTQIFDREPGKYFNFF